MLSTVYRLFDLDYNIYVIDDNTMELVGEGFEKAAKEFTSELFISMKVKMISLEEALQMLKLS